MSRRQAKRMHSLIEISFINIVNSIVSVLTGELMHDGYLGNAVVADLVHYGGRSGRLLPVRLQTAGADRHEPGLRPEAFQALFAGRVTTSFGDVLLRVHAAQG
jgi:hypothetical protein